MTSVNSTTLRPQHLHFLFLGLRSPWPSARGILDQPFREGGPAPFRASRFNPRRGTLSPDPFACFRTFGIGLKGTLRFRFASPILTRPPLVSDTTCRAPAVSNESCHRPDVGSGSHCARGCIMQVICRALVSPQARSAGEVARTRGTQARPP